MNRRGTYRHHCGGTIIGWSWILTAAHCLTVKYDNTQFEDLTDWIVVAGTCRLGPTGSSEPGAQKIKIQAAYVSPDWTYGKYGNRVNDVGLLKLMRPLKPNGISRIYLWKTLPMENVRQVEIIGWGNLYPGGPTTDVLRGYTTTLYEPCFEVEEKMLCVAGKGRVGPCKGDSGGPLHVVVGGTDDHPNLSVVGPVSKVVGGTHQPIEEFPFLGTLQSYKHFCGASIIDEEWILTAAHCMEGEKIENLFIAVGTNGSDRSHTSQAQKGYISEVFVNPGYVETNDEILLHDLALLKLTRPLNLSGSVRKISLRKNLLLEDGAEMKSAGWGAYEPDAKPDRHLRPILLLGYTGKLVTGPKCPESENTYEICFDGETDKQGHCVGDSGSPIAYYDIPLQNYVQVTLVSASTGPDCRPETTMTKGPDLTNYCDWFEKAQAATGCKDRIVEADGLPPASGIVGGVEISVEDYPFIVSIGHLDSVTKKFEHQCGASIIDQRWLLTAGHCLRSLGVNGAVAGSTHTGAHPDKNAQTFAFEEKHTHPDYIDEDGFPQDDVALIKLAKPIQYGLRVQPLVLTRKLEIANDTNIVILGWGLTKAGGPFTSESLLGFTGKFVPSCSSSSKLCFDGGNKARGTCDGDSGSPLVYCNRRINRFVQASLVSEGTGLCGSKDDDTIGPAVSRHCDWIEKTIDKKICITE
ncbi:unnamed protein product, partial [Mesorhabditis spiculigera]